MKTPSGLLQGATRRATASAWSLHPCLPLGSSQHLGSESKWAGLSQSCLGHREEGKIFSPDQLETTKEAKVTQRLPPKVIVPLGRSTGSRVLLWPQGSRRGKVASSAVSSCPQGPCSWLLACFPEASAPSWS